MATTLKRWCFLLHRGECTELGFRRDFHGAKAAGLTALLVQRQEVADIPEDIIKSGVTIPSLTDVISIVEKANRING